MSYCYVCSVLGILLHCVVLCTVLLPPGVNPIAVNEYISINININFLPNSFKICVRRCQLVEWAEMLPLDHFTSWV